MPDGECVLKRLGGAALILVVTLAGMAAAAVVGLRLVGGEPASAVPEPPPRDARAAAAPAPAAATTDEQEAEPHRWEKPCAAAKADAEVLVALTRFDSVEAVIDFARKGIAVNERLHVALRRLPPQTAAERKLLARLELSIRDDHAEFARWRETPTRSALQRWLEISRRHNVALRAQAAVIGAPTCADLFST